MALEKKKSEDRGAVGAGAGDRLETQANGSQPVKVYSYSGFKGEQKPRAFEIEGNRLTVLSVIRSWEEESEVGRHRKTLFQVHAHDGRRYELALDKGSGEWTLERRRR